MSLDRHSDDADEPPRARPGIRIAGDGGTRGQRHPEWVSTDAPLDNPIPMGNQLGTAHYGAKRPARDNWVDLVLLAIDVLLDGNR